MTTLTTFMDLTIISLQPDLTHKLPNLTYLLPDITIETSENCYHDYQQTCDKDYLFI